MHEETSDCYDTNKIQITTTVLRMDWMARRIRSRKRAERMKHQSQATFINTPKILKTGAASAEHGSTGPKRQAEDSKLHTAQKMRIRHLIMARWPAGSNVATQKCAAGKYGE